MALYVVRRTLFSVLILSLIGFALPTGKIHQDVLSGVLSRLAQPYSLELWTHQSCETHFDVRGITVALSECNATFIYHRNITLEAMSRYFTKWSLRILPGNLHRYVMIQMCLLGDVTRELKILQNLFQRVNFILSTRFMFQPVREHQVLCHTLQLVWDPEKNVTLLGLPDKSPSINGCSRWHFHDCSSLKRLVSFPIPWYRSVVTSHPSLRASVISGMCHTKCNISESITIISKVYNFTIADCTDQILSCDFIEHDDERTVTGLMDTGRFLPLTIFSSRSSAFLVPKGGLRPKWEYLARPFELSVWIGFLFSIAAILCFFLLSIMHLRPPVCNAFTHLRRLFEFLICSFFAPVVIPRKRWISAVLLLIWSLLMQIPANGFRAIIISCLNEPPRKNVISGVSELAAKLVVDTDPTLLCLQDIEMLSALFDIYEMDRQFYVGDSLYGSTKHTKNIHAFQKFCKVISPKVRYSGCKEYVQNGSGVFFGIENRIRATVEGDTEISWNRFTRLPYVPNTAYVVLKSHLQRPLSTSLLRLFESQIESHLDTLRYVGQMKLFSAHNERFISPYKIEDLQPFIQLWLYGILMASIVFLLERVVSRIQVIFFRHSRNSTPPSCE